MTKSPVRKSLSRLIWPAILLAVCALCLTESVPAQPENYTRLPVENDDWNKPFPAFRIVGNLYYVGGYDLASYLITTPKGHILINTGAYDSVPGIRKSVESLGFDLADIKILLTMQAHWDHVAGLAEIKRLTGARLIVHRDDAPVIENGGIHQFFNSDPLQFTRDFGGAVFEPAKVDRRVSHGDKIKIGGTELTVIHHPGHTRGATSFTFTVREGRRHYKVLIVNMGSVNSNRGVKLLGMALFPNIAESYRKTFASQKRIRMDIWVSSHAGHFNLHEKYKPGDPYDPSRFVDQKGYIEKVKMYEERFLKTLNREKATRASKAQN